MKAKLFDKIGLQLKKGDNEVTIDKEKFTQLK